jgi:hypothetical protein
VLAPAVFQLAVQAWAKLKVAVVSWRSVEGSSGHAGIIGFYFLTIWQNLSVHGSVLGVFEDLPLENKGNRKRY